MKLRYSSTSPYVRKCLVVAIEAGIEDQIERVSTAPWAPDTDIGTVNPLGKVPALETDDGLTLFDSPVICEYLANLNPSANLFPAAGPKRWKALAGQALADGLLDAGVARLLEGRRAEGERSPGWIKRQIGVMDRAYDALDADCHEWGKDACTIAQITAGCAIGWMDFRFADDDWRTTRPALADWYAEFSGRPSMMATEPAE